MTDDHTTIADRLLRLDSCAVSDALDSLQLSGTVTGLKCLSGTRRIAGLVHTVKLGTTPPDGGSVRHLCTGAIESAAAGEIIVVEQTTGLNAAGWGGVLSNAAKAKQLAGAIVEGPARDIDESIELEFPVFARLATARTARGRVYEQDFDCPVTVGDITVNPGDYVLADSSAAVFLPADRCAEIIGIAERIAAREALMTKAIWEGEPVSRVMGKNYESMLDDLGEKNSGSE